MVKSHSQTVDEHTVEYRRSSRAPVPGALVLFHIDRPVHLVVPARNGLVALGRDRLAELGLPDPRVSRQHVECRWDDGAWTVRDLASRNGTSLDAQSITGEVRAGERAVVRIGDTIAWLVPDVIPYAERAVAVENEQVVGATLGAVLAQIRQAAEGRVLHVTGPSGAGKELAARAFHRLGPRRDGPFVAINCAAIPEGVAERVLFGARKGAFSGAHADAPGHFQEADGGTLFLDEVGELDLNVQARLLRALEAGEVIPVGASRPVKVDVRFCSATHRDLRERVSAKRFREDLYYRIGRPHVELPPLRARREEIPTLVDREVRAAGRRPHSSLIELCLVRPWPGNVRELRVEVGAAARGAVAAGDDRVRAGDLSPTAGVEFAETHRASSPPEPAARSSETGSTAPARTKEMPSRETIEAALRANEGRVASTARALGLHRNQLRRWITANHIDPRAFAVEGAEGDDDGPE
jgi:transcriptional regulator with GAF, ATPase, and Fis domain